MTQLDLNAFLNDQADDGVKDSEGDFTISHTNARRKLAKFALPRKHAWVSKLVQASVAWDVRNLHMAQNKTETQFFLEPQSVGSLPTETEIVNTLLSGKVVAETALEHFCVALRASVEQAGLSFILAINDGDVKPQPVYAGEYYGSVSESERLDAHYNRGKGITLTLRHAPAVGADTPISHLLGSYSYGVPILEELRDYAYTSPVPLRCSGLRLDGFLNCRAFLHNAVPLLTTGVRNLEKSPGLMRLPTSFEERQFSYLTHANRARRPYGGSRDFDGVYLLSTKLSADGIKRKARRSTMNWVKDGVVVESHALEVVTESLSISIYADATGLRSDLTGFQLVEDDVRLAREGELLQEVGRDLNRWRTRLDDFFRPDQDESSYLDLKHDQDAAFKARVSKLLGGGGLGVLLSLTNPVLGVGATLFTLFQNYKDVGRSSAEEEFRRAKKDSKETLENEIRHVSLNLVEVGTRKLDSLSLKPPMNESLAGEIPDPSDASAMEIFLAEGVEDPVALAALLAQKMESQQDEPLWNLHLARVYRRSDDLRASLFYNRYLHLKPDREVYLELAELYDEQEKGSLAVLVRDRAAKLAD